MTRSTEPRTERADHAAAPRRLADACGGRAAARARRWVEPRCSSATRRSGRATRGVQATIAERLGWLDAPSHFPSEIGRPRRLRRRGRRRRVHDRDRRPAWAAAASPRTCCTRAFGDGGEGYSTCASSTRPTRPPSRRPSTTSIRCGRCHRRHKSGTTTEPNAFLADAWARLEAALEARASATCYARRATSSRSPTRTRASRRSPTTTTSARSSSTRPTSAAATPR